MSDGTKEGEGAATPQSQLKHADQNPWYVLMTLYGDDHDKNRRVWNAWAGQVWSQQQKDELPEAPSLVLNEMQDWETLKDEVEDLFNKRWSSQKTEQPRLPDPRAEVDLSNLHFDQRLDLKGMVFPKQVSFAGSNIRFGIWANNTWFHRLVSFSHTRIGETVIFDSAKFEDHAIFGATKFIGDAQFDKVTFCNETHFFKAKFEASSSFILTEFRKEAKFSGCEFAGFSSFRAAKFFSNAGFQSVQFKGIADFAESEFHASGTKGIAGIRFTDAIFSKPTSFRGATFKHSYPELTNTDLYLVTDFSADALHWPEGLTVPSKEARESCGIIRNLLSKKGLTEDQHFFFRREMFFASHQEEWLSRIPYQVYGWLSDYGHSIARPFWGLFVVWFIGVAFFSAHFMADLSGPLQDANDWTALGLSFSNLFPVFGFGRVHFMEVLKNLPAGLQFLSGFQTVTSLPLLFFLGLGLRQRFRLR